MLTRRRLLQGASSLAILAGSFDFVTAGINNPGSGSSAGLAPAKRSSINVNGPDTFTYAFIDHMKQGDGNFGPDGAGWSTAATPFHQNVDANGWVNVSSTLVAGCGPRIPGSDSFSGPYVLTWTGNGTAFINCFEGNLTWTQDNSTPSGDTSGTYTGGGTVWTNVAGQTARVIIKPSVLIGPAQLNIGHSSTDGTLKNLQFYRYEDEADLLAGKIFRTGWKQNIINLNPRHIRCLDFMGANDSSVVRFEHRNKPSYAGWFANFGANGQPKYGTTSTGSSQLTLGSATGMPGAMQHGEQVTARIGETSRNSAHGILFISSITVAANAKVTIDLTKANLTANVTSISWAGGTATVNIPGHNYTAGSSLQLRVAGASPSGYNGDFACTIVDASTITYAVASPGGTSSVGTIAGHGYPNGENVALIMHDQIQNQPPTGMTQMDRLVATVASATPDTFLTGINSSTFSTFTVGTCVTNLTLNVGARGVFPVVLQDGNSPALKFATLTGGSQAAFTFDKNLIANIGTSGAWILRGNTTPLTAGVPPEIVTTLVNELMQMGPKNPINLYITLPPLGMNSSDPDYSSASNFAVNYVDIVMNPASSIRAVGFSALDSRCTLYVEHGNETWQSGNFVSCLYQAWRGYLNWPALGATDFSTFSSLRAVQTVKDIKSAFPPASNPRIKYVLGLMSTFGGASGTNLVRFNGNSQYNAAIGDGNTPLFNFDHANFAGYFQNNNSTPANSLTTCVAQWQAAGSNSVLQEAAYNAYVQGFVQTALGGAETIQSYITKVTQAASDAAAQGKTLVGYEGGMQPDLVTRASNRGNFINNNTSVSSIRNNAQYTAGYYVVGPGIPALTTVVSSGAGTMVMSNAFAGATAQSTFLVFSPSAYFIVLAKASQSWATSHRTWFDAHNSISGADAPAEFIIAHVGQEQWSHVYFDDSYAFTTNEAAGLDFDIIGQGSRNAGH